MAGRFGWKGDQPNIRNQVAAAFSEAILWHGGEAESARQFYLNLPAQSRASLLAFLETL